MTEEWKIIFLGKLQQPSNYEVSSLGRVRNRKTLRQLKSFFVKNRNGDLYEKVNLSQADIRYPRFVHRLVGAAFHDNPTCKPEINHEDANTLNNRKDNLEWVTRKENEDHKHFMEA